VFEKLFVKTSDLVFHTIASYSVAAAGLALVHLGGEDWATAWLRDGESTVSARQGVSRLGSHGTTVP
jgi:hypothetical protein